MGQFASRHAKERPQHKHERMQRQQQRKKLSARELAQKESYRGEEDIVE
jgi:hypothetical protein